MLKFREMKTRNLSNNGHDPKNVHYDLDLIDVYGRFIVSKTESNVLHDNTILLLQLDTLDAHLCKSRRTSM